MWRSGSPPRSSALGSSPRGGLAADATGAYLRGDMRKRIAVLVAAALGMAMVSCSSAPSPGDIVAAFTAALNRRDPNAAADLTDDPATARPDIASMFDGMGDAATVQVAAGDVDDSSRAGLRYHWTWGPGRDFRYDTTVAVTGDDNRWRIDWSPTVLHPQLRPGLHFQYSEDRDLQTPVVDRTGQPLMTWQTVGLVTLQRAHQESAAALAPVLAPFDPSTTPESIAAQFRSTRDEAVTVMRLRADDLATVRDQVAAIPGVTVVEQGDLLTANRELSSPAIDGLPQFWRDWIARTEGWSVDLVDGRGAPAEELTSTPGKDTGPVRTSLDLRLQLLAQQAVDREQRPAMLVAIAPSSGGILAVAQNPAADAQGAPALSGLYPPGSTFKTITTAAALRAGLVGSDTPVACPGRVTVENRTIPNEDEFDLGTVPMATAYARSCNTTMGALADRLPPNALTDTARQFGIGVDFVAAGVTTVTGRVPPADDAAQRVENGIGQGTVTASPFGMAVTEASLAHGATITPFLIDGEPTKADTPQAQLPPEVVSALRGMMRQTVEDGTASALSDIPGLGGKTGTAEFGDNTHSHGWFAGVVDDIAFATLVVGGDSSAPAVAISGDFLRPARSG
jgi:Penicillin binding protein transpeptidase domain/NTF2-like N-terminal transpeptidase domain